MDLRLFCRVVLCWWLCPGEYREALDVYEDKHLENQKTYNTRWDKVDLDEILANKRLLTHYFNCLLDKGPCAPDGRELKRVLPEALATGCAKCSKSQLAGGVKVIQYLREYEPEKFKALANKYDPHGTYRRKYLEYNRDEDNTIEQTFNNRPLMHQITGPNRRKLKSWRFVREATAEPRLDQSEGSP